MTRRSTTSVQPLRLAIAIITGAVVNLAIYLIGAAAGASMSISSPAMQITAATIIIGTIVPLALMGTITWVSSRRVPASRVWLAWAGLTFAVLGTASPFMFAADITTAFTLAFIHVAAGVAWFIGLAPWQRSAVRAANAATA